MAAERPNALENDRLGDVDSLRAARRPRESPEFVEAIGVIAGETGAVEQEDLPAAAQRREHG